MSYFLCPFLPRSCARSLTASFHSTTNNASQRMVRKGAGHATKRTSRTRLEKDLKSGSNHVQRDQRKKEKSDFQRDTLPHVGRDPKQDIEPRKRQPRPLSLREHSSPSSWDWEMDIAGKQKPRVSAPSSSTASRSVRRDREARRLTPTHEGQSEKDLPTHFASPPLLPGLLSCLKDLIGPNSTPTPIQSLSLKSLVESSAHEQPSGEPPANQSNQSWKQFLLASETGSGKSIAYLLPVIQALKQSESLQRPQSSSQNSEALPLNPRALVLAPTHELSRQLTTFAKSLIHEVKLRILCASRANTRSSRFADESVTSETVVNSDAVSSTSPSTTDLLPRENKNSWPVDMVIGTPNRLLDMVRGRGWDREEVEEIEEDDQSPRSWRDRFGPSKPEMGLANIEWVVIDEADVLMDPDFRETTLKLLSDIATARGYAVPQGEPDAPNAVVPHDYPFNFVLTSATIPSALASYLDAHHPKLTRLVSPGVHHLPKTLQTEFVNWSGGNKNADIEHRIRRVWAEDASNTGLGSKRQTSNSKATLSKVLIFCNQNIKVDALSEYLTTKGIKNVALTSQGAERKKGSNHHLDGFLRIPGHSRDGTSHADAASTSDPSKTPHVMITTSLLSRGLDFSPEMRHIFIVDEPRNMIDFLHRAGRSGRAGQRGKVVVFGKMKGRGSAKAKDVRQKVKSLV